MSLTTRLAMTGLALLCCSTTIYADTASAVQQGNSNADSIAAAAQTNMVQQQQVLAQRLQALSAAMQAQNPSAPIVVQALPQAPKQAAPVVAPAATPPSAATQAPAASEHNATGLNPPAQSNNGNNSNQWNYGF